jgi:hypothetical protein
MERVQGNTVRQPETQRSRVFMSEWMSNGLKEAKKEDAEPTSCPKES